VVVEEERSVGLWKKKLQKSHLLGYVRLLSSVSISMSFLIKNGLSKRQAKAKFVSQQHRSINRNVGDTMEQSDNERISQFEVNETFNHFIDSELVDEYPSVIHDDITDHHSLRFIINR